MELNPQLTIRIIMDIKIVKDFYNGLLEAKFMADKVINIKG